MLRSCAQQFSVMSTDRLIIILIALLAIFLKPPARHLATPHIQVIRRYNVQYGYCSVKHSLCIRLSTEMIWFSSFSMVKSWIAISWASILFIPEAHHSKKVKNSNLTLSPSWCTGPQVLGTSTGWSGLSTVGDVFLLFMLLHSTWAWALLLVLCYCQQKIALVNHA